MSRCHYSVHQEPSCKWDSSNLCSLSAARLFTARATPFESAVVRRVSLLCRFLCTCVVETNEKYFPTHICILIKRNDIIAVKFFSTVFSANTKSGLIRHCSPGLGVDAADNREKTFVAQLNNFQMGWNKCRAMWTENWDNQKRRFVPPARRRRRSERFSQREGKFNVSNHLKLKAGWFGFN